MKDRDIQILNKIIKYTNEISGTIERFNLDLNKFNDDYVMKNAISMCLLQIGELVGHLSTELRKEYNEMPWRDIVSLRNRAAHAYGEIDVEVLWNIAADDIPALKDYCETIMKGLQKQ